MGWATSAGIIISTKTGPLPPKLEGSKIKQKFKKLISSVNTGVASQMDEFIYFFKFVKVM